MTTEHGAESAVEEDIPGREEAGPVRRRKGRTALLIGAAAVLGLVGGVCGGYLVQADRDPTELPPLSQAAPARGEGPAPEPLPASRDRRVRTEGDLRDLLVEKPAGAREADGVPEDGWLDLAGYAGTFTQPGAAYERLVEQEFRRGAVTGWRTDDDVVEIRLLQFRQEEVTAAADAADEGRFWAEDAERGDTESEPIPGTGDGRAYVRTEPDGTTGVPLYHAEAHAWRGDIALEIWIDGTEPITLKRITDLAERQMERL